MAKSVFHVHLMSLLRQPLSLTVMQGKGCVSLSTLSRYNTVQNSSHVSTISWKQRVRCKKQWLFTMTCQQYVSTASDISLPGTKSTKKKRSSRRKFETIVNESRSSSTQEPMPVEELKLQLKVRKQSYVFDEFVAEKVVAAVMKHRANPQAPILEVDAGPGLVSKEFLKQGVSKVVALERNQQFVPFHSALQKEVGEDKLIFLHWQMVNLYLKFHSSLHTEAMKTYHRMELYTAELLKLSPNSRRDVPYSLFCLGGKEENDSTIYYILHSLLNDDVLLSQGPVEFFLLIHPKFKVRLDYISSLSRKTDGIGTVSIKDRSRAVRFSYIHILIHLFYEVQIVGQFDATDFYPSFSTVVPVQDRGLDLDCNKRLLMKLKRKENANEILPLEHHTAFAAFLQQIYKKKLSRTIPAMEMLIPGCGLRMIAEGFNMMEKIVVTQSEDFLRLFKLILDWPEYKNSPLYSHIMMKTRGSVDDEGAGETEKDEDSHV